ncbi:protein serine/threonine phosphatase [Aureococcus anophagefferens]|nr:protein serine/threonine phosphatase [Aureococcus anophagefferens]
MYSGTTAISVFCDRGTLYVSNVFTHDLKPSDRVIIVASDGVFEFLTSASASRSPCSTTTWSRPLQPSAAAYKMWITRELRSDDITIVVAYVEPPSLERRDSTSVNSPVDTADNADPRSAAGAGILLR